MQRHSVSFVCPACGLRAPGAVEVPDELADCWLEVRASGFQAHVEQPDLRSVLATRAEARRVGGHLMARGSCPRCGSAINLPVGG